MFDEISASPQSFIPGQSYIFLPMPGAKDSNYSVSVSFRWSFALGN
jgi:hypothetical protein